MCTLLLSERPDVLWETLPEDSTRLPAGFPDRIRGASVWSEADFPDDNSYVEWLSADDVQEIENALAFFKASQAATSELGEALFPLCSTLAARLRATSRAIHGGRGFAVLRGLDPTKYSDQDNALIFAGIAAYIGRERSNLRHIYDRSKQEDVNAASLRPPGLSINMSFHTDVNSGDILALYMQNVSKYGGEQSVVSFSTVYNDLVRENPAVLLMLAQKWRYEVPWSDHVEVFDRPVIHYHHGKLMIAFAKSHLLGSAWDTRLPEGAPASNAQHQAIAILEKMLAQRRVRLTQRRGDILFVNNLSVLHAREGFVDDESQGQIRHVVNLMLCDPEYAWSQPASMSIYSQARFSIKTARDVLTSEQYEASLKNKTPKPMAHD